MKKKLFCEISPITYKISKQINIFKRHISNLFSKTDFAYKKSDTWLDYEIFSHKSLIKRIFKDIDMTLQENKRVNLSIAAPKINGMLIYPGEVFSFFKLVGKMTKAKGYKLGLTIMGDKVSSDIGGGMCQFTNLLHYIVLNSPLEIVEHHHHDGFDLFPDYKRKVPFGTGTSISYNYLDYRFKNTTDNVFQLIVYEDGEYLYGKLLSDAPIEFEYEITVENERFVKENDGFVYRKGDVFRICRNKKTGDVIFKECIRENNAKVMYNTENIDIINT